MISMRSALKMVGYYYSIEDRARANGRRYPERNDDIGACCKPKQACGIFRPRLYALELRPQRVFWRKVLQQAIRRAISLTL